MFRYFRLISLGLLLATLSSKQILAWEINFKRLFFANPSVTEVFSHSVVASYESQYDSLFVIIDNNTDQVFTAKIGEHININNEVLILEAFSEDSLNFKNSNGDKFVLSYLNSDQSKEYISKKNQKTFNLFALPDRDSSLGELKLMALELGIPDQLVKRFVSLPPLARDSVGRPGWLLDDTIPAALLKLSPFKLNDLIISVNGIAINEREELSQHVQSGSHNKLFKVEIERSGELKLITVKF